MEITKVYSQEIPATRFIGKKYGESDRVNGNFGSKWGEAFGSGLFDTVENAAGGAEKLGELFEDAGAYIGLMRCKGDEPFEYWIGMFTPADTAVPEGFGYVDFPLSKLGIGWVYGSEATGEVYCHEEDVAKKLGEAGMEIINDETGACWCFERYTCPRFTTPDDKGNIILDICFFIK